MIPPRNSPPAPPPLAQLADDPGGWALFLDFDGTLVDIAPTPDAIVVPTELHALLQTLAYRFGKALAIVTGRALADLDRRLGGLRLPAVGQHGAELRMDPEKGAEFVSGGPALDAARRRVREFSRRYPAVLVEDKGAAVALHFRADPDAGAAVRALAAQIASESHGALEVTPGKAVCEIRPAGADKGAALRTFLGSAPFSGRRPLVVGDDFTDEAAFAAALAAEGSAVKVGTGTTRAPWRLAAPAAVRRWLAGSN